MSKQPPKEVKPMPGAKPVGEPDQDGDKKTRPEQPVVAHDDGRKPVGEADQGLAQRPGPELPVITPIDGVGDYKLHGFQTDTSAYYPSLTDTPKKTGKPVPGFVTYKLPDGTMVTNEVDDIHNPPPHKLATMGEGAKHDETHPDAELVVATPHKD